MNFDFIEQIPVFDTTFYRRLITNPSIWLKPVLVAGMLLFSIALPFLPGQRYYIFLLGLVPGIFFTIALLRWPGLGLPALIVASLFVPFAIGTGTETSINATIMLLSGLIGLWLLSVFVKRGQVNFVKSRTFRPLAIFLVVVVVAFFVGQLPWFSFARQTASISAQLGGLFLFFLSAGAFFLVANQVKEIRWLELMTFAFVGLGGLFIAGWLLPGVGSISSRIFQFGAIDGGMFWTWLVALAFSQALINTKLKWGWRFALGITVAATLYVGYFLNSGWKTGYLPPLIVIISIIILRSWRVGLLLVLGGIVVIPFLISDAIETDQYSYSTRIEAGLIMGEMIRTSPILGFGPANYYYFTPLFPIRGYAVEFNSHNQYIDIVAQVGFLGLLILFWFLFEVGRLGFQLRKRVQSGFEEAYVYGALGGLAGTLAAGMLADWFLPFVYNVGYTGFRASVLAWIFMGGLVSLEVITRNRERSQEPSNS
ncbi:MAG: O-antigen ligase family protein [Anaerolineae bacterium]|nr:MAG: O-antigen ligase family protein [Anaerolineae bacterium]